MGGAKGKYLWPSGLGLPRSQHRGQPVPMAPPRGSALVHAGRDPRTKGPEARAEPLPACGDLYNCLLSALSVFPLLSSSAQNTDSFTVSCD